MNNPNIMRAYYVLGVMTFIFLVSIGAVLFETWSIKGLYAEAADRATKLATTLAEQEQYKRARGAIEETTAQRKELSEYFTPESQAVDFIEEVETLGVANNLTTVLSSIDIVPLPTPRLVISVRVEGTWQNVMYYLALVEAMPRHIEIREVSLAEIPSDEKTNRWRGAYDIVLLSFQKAEKK